MDWLKKLGEYAPDIVGAVLSGGATLPATALRIASKELLGYETDDKNLVEKAVNDATPEQMLKLKQANHEFRIRKVELQNEDLANQRADTQDARKRNNGHWMTFALPLLMFVLFSGMAYGLMKYAIPAENKDILVFMAGQVSGFMAAGVTYWLGSSRGSAEKQMKLK